jgi:hypothetical protein
MPLCGEPAGFTHTSTPRITAAAGTTPAARTSLRRSGCDGAACRPPEGIIADLQAAASKAGIELTIVVSDEP